MQPFTQNSPREKTMASLALAVNMLLVSFWEFSTSSTKTFFPMRNQLATDESRLRIVDLANRIGRGPDFAARAHCHAVRHHEVNELGDTGILCSRTIIHGDDYLGDVLNEAILLGGKEKRLI